MLKDKHIFILGAAKFDGPDQSTSLKIARELAKNNFVYYIDYPITLKDYFTDKNTSYIKFRASYFSPFSDGIVQTDQPNLKIIIPPPVISINFLPEGFIYRSLLRLNERFIRNRLRKVIRANKINQFIYINSFNFHYPDIADQLKPLLTIYHCFDPMIIPYDMKHGIISENELVKKSDLVICTSRQLYLEKKELNKNIFFIPNAADIEHSIKALDKELAVHESLFGLKNPIIGYVGSIERRFDYDLLKLVIEKNKDKTFVFAGPMSREFVPDWFLEAENIFLTGRVPYEQIPALIKGFDIAIIPFKKDRVSGTIFPLKLFEYLGAGKPVISTMFNPDLEDFTNGTVFFCDDALSFCKAVEHALKNDDPIGKQSRIDTARKNTWEKRGIAISDIISLNLETQTAERDVK